MTTLFTDTGAGADANPIGGDYTTWAGFNAWRRLSNVLFGTVSSGNNGAYVNSVGDQANSWIQATVRAGSTSHGLMLRCATSGDSEGYAFQVYSGTAQIARWDSGASYNVLDSVAAAIVPGDVLYFEALGTTLTAKINGVDVLSVVDATYASGRFGLYTYNDVDGLDTLTAGNFTAPPDPPPPSGPGVRAAASDRKLLRPGIPAVDLAVDPKLRKVVMAIKENIEISNGIRAGTGVNEDAWKRRTVSLHMLIKLGLITEEQARSVWQEP